MHSGPNIGETLLIDLNLSVQDRLSSLRETYASWQHEDSMLAARLEHLNPDKPIDIQKGAQISTLRRRRSLQIVGSPLEISTDVNAQVGYEALRNHLAQQYAQLSKASKKLWLSNYLFVITPDLRRLSDKIANVRSHRSLGQQRNFLLGGPSGMGKTTCLDWFTFNNLQEVSAEHNHVPVVKIDAPVSNHTPKPLLQRMILECGMNYLRGDNEEDLLMKIALYFQRCAVEVVIVDEIEHITRHEIRRRLLEVSNLTRGVTYICASCHPTRWLEGDLEVAGRWNDYLELKQYTGKRLEGLLALIELLLPFSQPSLLAEHTIEIRNGRKTETVDGPAQYIERWTGGILREIMILLFEASRRAIELGESRLSLPRLQETWNDINDKAVKDFLMLVKESRHG